MENKCVMIIREDLPPGLAANTAAIMGITLGKAFPEAVGETVTDGTGREHLGIITVPVPVLRGSREEISALWARLREPAFAGITVVDFTGLAQGCRTYDEYTAKMAETPGGGLDYLGLALYGDKRRVSGLTGHMALLR